MLKAIQKIEDVLTQVRSHLASGGVPTIAQELLADAHAHTVELRERVAAGGSEQGQASTDAAGDAPLTDDQLDKLKDMADKFETAVNEIRAKAETEVANTVARIEEKLRLQFEAAVALEVDKRVAAAAAATV